MQSVGDSLFYALKDSVFRLFKSPVVWAQANQVTGDTIYMYLKNSKPERLYVFENAMALSQVDSTIYFNQVKGNTINAYFDTTGQIQFLRSKGNSENVYYATDEGGHFIGVNRNSSDVVEIRFADGKAKRVLLINGVDGTMYPMRQVNHEDLKLRNFRWLDNLRPKSRYDILSSQ